MSIKQGLIHIGIAILLCLSTTITSAHPQDIDLDGIDGLGQTIEIHTRLRSFIGKPSWTLIIRDLDHGQNIPYLFDFTRGDDHWVVFTYSRNFLITASRLQIETYRSRYNKFKNYRINNFCNIESNGRIIRGNSMYITIEGDLSPYSNSYTCNVSSYPDGKYFISKSE